MAKRLDGITPACAGKRAAPYDAAAFAWDHPRVRGEKSSSTRTTAIWPGSPPRARGKAAMDVLEA